MQAKTAEINTITLNTETAQVVNDIIITSSSHEQRHVIISKESTEN